MTDYAERVYAGVLGKIIGVYLGRPFEQWTHEQIEERLGEITGYVTGHPAIEPAKRGNPLVLTDDDISGTFTFLRAIEDHGPDVTPAQIGQTWLNYVIEGRSTHWWGGIGVSTEHTAYLHLKDGVRAPESGSAALNGKVLSEQIGAQIFIDGWGMVCPGDPERAADLARRAASVSHDGEAVYAAQVVAAMEAQAFVEQDVGAAARRRRRPDPARQRDRARARGRPRLARDRRRLAPHARADRGALRLPPLRRRLPRRPQSRADRARPALRRRRLRPLADDRQHGRLGHRLQLGQRRLPARDPRRRCRRSARSWREPVRDRMYLSSADGGRAITDAATEAVHVVNAGRILAGEPPWRPPRFHFSFPGSVQGFDAEHADGSLAVDGIAVTPTFIPREAFALSALRAAGLPHALPRPDRAGGGRGRGRAAARPRLRRARRAGHGARTRGRARVAGARHRRAADRRGGRRDRRPGAAALADLGRGAGGDARPPGRRLRSGAAPGSTASTAGATAGPSRTG